MYINLPAPHPPSPRSLRRYPLTPPAVAPPSVNTQHSSVVMRPSPTSASSTGAAQARATALLSRVVSSPSASRRCSQASTPLATPATESLRLGFHAATHEFALANDEEDPDDAKGQGYEGFDAIRYWNGHEQRDGYISFPDFDLFRQACERAREFGEEGHGSKS